ncbi:MAG: VOC family protein [Pseudomonadota bacterium]
MTTSAATKPEATSAAQSDAPNLMFSHMGFAVKDMAKMEDFYTRVLGFTVTDRGHAVGMDLIFLSRDPQDHHQLVLVSGKPDNIPPNPFNAQFGSVINQISFRVGSLDSLRKLQKILERENIQSIFPANHGIAWSIYCHDPDGNNLELFVDTEWYFPQPFLIPLDLTQSDEAIHDETLALAKEQQGFEPTANWRKRMGARMNRFVPGL